MWNQRENVPTVERGGDRSTKLPIHTMAGRVVDRFVRKKREKAGDQSREPSARFRVQQRAVSKFENRQNAIICTKTA